MQSRRVGGKLFWTGVPPSLCCKVVEKVRQLSYKGVFRSLEREKLDLKLGCLKLGCLDVCFFRAFCSGWKYSGPMAQPIPSVLL